MINGNQIDYEKMEELAENENTHILKLWTPCKFNIDKNYNYIYENFIFNFFSNLVYYGIAFPILSILLKLVYDFKIEGKENLEKVEAGAISVSNHVLILDCAMVGLALGKKKVYFTTTEESFKIPLVRKLIKLLRAIPIPKTIENKKYFIKAVDKLLKKGKIVHMYPEAALWPYCQKIRNFKKGAFDFAIRNDVPIIPIIIKFRAPKGIRKLFKKKKDVTLKILEPVKLDEKEIKNNFENKTAEELLKEKVHFRMESEM